jgi:hypothetical protein
VETMMLPDYWGKSSLQKNQHKELLTNANR